MQLCFYIVRQDFRAMVLPNGFLAEVAGPFPSIDEAKDWAEKNLPVDTKLKILSGVAPQGD